MTGKMAIMGSGDNILAFKAGGVDAYTVSKIEDARDLLRKLAKEYAVIFITDNFCRELAPYLKRFNQTAYPIIVPISEGDGDYGMELLRQAMEGALGVDILFGREDR